MTCDHRRPGLNAEEISTILDSIADGVFTVDRDFIITSFDRAAERTTRFSGDGR